MNYDYLMEEDMKNIPEGSKLLLHACCAPCSSAVLERLSSYFQITIFYYNPNITEEDEYQKRIHELKRFVSMYQTKYKIDILEGKYEPEKWWEISKGLENEPERGKRCYKCYELRLEETAKVAEEFNFPYFCTTLTLSPHKNANWINEIGEKLDQNYKPHYLYSDFKKKNGYKRSIELSKEYDLYRQDYCGCIFSKKTK
ncbi:MAG: epoxyqueuosine reductase QueH [Bacilli bacterium]|nr:epoxyqueuosine reductase QueH [Bacilli bacterium]